MRKFILPLLAISMMAVAGCEGTAGQSSSPVQNDNLNDRAKMTLEQMEAGDPALRNVVDNAYGYAVFPEAAKAAAGIGGAGGRGAAYQHGQLIGTATLHQASLGVQLGGETYAELVVFQTPAAFAIFQNGNLEFGTDASATLIKAGAAAAGQFNNGTRIFVLPKGGLMAGISVNGQKFEFKPWTNNGM